MLVQLENQYSYGLQISELHVRHLNENHLKDLKALKRQTIFKLLLRLLHVQLVNILWLWYCPIEPSEKFHTDIQFHPYKLKIA